MSGPKVVRVVTREELVAICGGLLVRSEAALQDWVRVGQRNDCVSEADVSAAEGRLERLRALLRADRFAEIQKQVPQEIESLGADMEARLARVAEATASQRNVERRRSDAAQALLKALRRRGVAISDDLESRLSNSGPGLDKALAEGFSILSGATLATDEARRALAEKLKDFESPRSLSAWIATQLPPEDSRTLRLENQLSELLLLDSSATTKAFDARFRAAIETDEPHRRRLLLDSIEIEMAQELRAMRQRQKLMRETESVLAELGLEARNEAERFRAAAKQEGANVRGILEQAKGLLNAQRAAEASGARRSAILKGLGALGYEVSEGLSTAWVEAGRIVLRKPAQPGYGVEIAGDAAGPRFQMRVVAFEGEADNDARRDKDAEVLWCSDLSELERQLAANGDGFAIERAHSAGSMPVKRVRSPVGSSDRIAVEKPMPLTRTLK